MMDNTITEYFTEVETTKDYNRKATKNPSLANVINIAKKCEISIDWLCGLSDNEHIGHESVWAYADIKHL